jgi:sec-independent protein translocase protein TatC
MATKKTKTSSSNKKKRVNIQKTPKVLPVNKTENNPNEDFEEEIDPREKYMTLGDHLEELRRRIFAILGVWLSISIIVGIFSEDIHKFLVQPFKEISKQPLLLGTIYGPLEIYFKLSIILGMIISLPFILSILWGFITPALSKRTAMQGYIIIFISSLLFWIGVFFAWEYLFPLSLKMMLEFFLPSETIAQTTIEKYYGFLFLILIGTGATFELPLLVIFLGYLGILTLEWHKKVWKFIIVIIFVFSAIISPPDPFSMFVLAIPLTILYFLSVGIVWMFELRRKKEYEEFEDSQ